MANHYSRPKGFVGRNICYAIEYEGRYYGSIVGGSATKHLPGKPDNLKNDLNSIVNNIFFHVEKPYPIRNFTQKVLSLYRPQIQLDWFLKYEDFISLHETLVELPRLGSCYLRDGWTEVGITKGFTCKRTAGKGTDSWGGKRVWDKVNLRPKRVFIKEV